MNISEKIIIPQADDPDFRRQILYIIEQLFRDLYVDLKGLDDRLIELEPVVPDPPEEP